MTSPVLFQITDVLLDDIDPNPFQTRSAEDPAHVQQIADSIRSHGLQQAAVGRIHAGRVQLASGHTRLAAFRLLAQTDPVLYATLPVCLRELTDQQMFEAAVVENNDRKDLTPIEKAKAMRIYAEEFGKTSAEVGALFGGLSDSAVRNYLRLLDLPEAVQEHVGAGALSQATARKLLTAQTVLSSARVENIASDIAAQARTGSVREDKIDSAIEAGMQHTKTAVKMWQSWQGGDPRGGSGLWLLDSWTVPAGAPPVKVKGAQLVKAYPWLERALADAAQPYGASVPSLLDDALNISSRNPHGPEVLERALDLPAQAAALINVLHYPPVCKRCPFYAVLQGTHYCGIRLCHDRKRKNWLENELQDLVVELGIPAYELERDGEDYEVAQRSVYENRVVDGQKRWGQYPTPYVEWFEKRGVQEGAHARLRLRQEKSSYQAWDFTGSYNVQLISVRPELKGTTEKKRKEDARRKAEYDHSSQEYADRQKRYEEHQANRRRSERFLEYAVPVHFAFAWSGLKFGELSVLVREIVDNDFDLPEDQGDAATLLRELLAERILYSAIDHDLRGEGPVAVAGHLVGLAREIGLALPPDFEAQALRFLDDDEEAKND